MTTQTFLKSNKYILILMGVFTILLITCLIVELATAGGTNKTNDFIFQPKLLVAGLYSTGMMLCALIPLTLAKVYYGHLLSSNSDSEDMELIAQSSVMTLTVTLIMFILGILVDYLFLSQPIALLTLMIICIACFKIVVGILAIIGACIILLKVFKNWIAPGASWLLEKTTAVAIIGFVCLLFLLGTCKGIRDMHKNDFAPPDTSEWSGNSTSDDGPVTSVEEYTRRKAKEDAAKAATATDDKPLGSDANQPPRRSDL